MKRRIIHAAIAAITVLLMATTPQSALAQRCEDCPQECNYVTCAGM